MPVSSCFCFHNDLKTEELSKRWDSRVRVGAPLAAVDYVEVFQRETKLGSELVDPLSQISFGKRRKLVEQRLDYVIRLLRLESARDMCTH